MLVRFPAPATIAVLDACVLYPAALRNTLLRAGEAGMYQVRWSEDVLEEVRRSLIGTGRQSETQAANLIAEFRRAFSGALVERYEGLIDTMGNHPKDRHVVAAAVTAGAGVIVTSNLRHFPDRPLAPYAIQAQSPDDFLCELFSEEPEGMVDILRKQAADLKDPPLTLADVMTELQRDAPRFVAAVVADGLWGY